MRVEAGWGGGCRSVYVRGGGPEQVAEVEAARVEEEGQPRRRACRSRMNGRGVSGCPCGVDFDASLPHSALVLGAAAVILEAGRKHGRRAAASPRGRVSEQRGVVSRGRLAVGVLKTVSVLVLGHVRAIRTGW